MKIVFKTAIETYKFFISPIIQGLGGGCRFHPPCSEYARQALEHYPLKRAGSLIIRRLLKCGPWNKGGVDFLEETR